MKPIICRCCGEVMSETGNPMSRNPNVCASCSSMADGMEGNSLPAAPASAPEAAERVAVPVEERVELQVS